MTKEEILALSDEELDMQAAELSGWVLSKDAVRMPDGSFRDLWNHHVIHNGALECFDHPPCFTRDIAAAWGLWEKGKLIGKRFWMALLEFCDNGDQTTIYERVLKGIDARNITRAFILAMTQTGLRVSNDNVEFIRDGKVVVDKHGVSK